MPGFYLKEELYSLIREDSSLFEWIQSGSLDGIWYWNMEKVEDEWYSDECIRLFGYDPEEVPNSSSWWQENIHPEDRVSAMASAAAHIADPSVPYDQIVRYYHKNGHIVWVRCRGIAIRDDDGKAIRFLGAHTDVSNLSHTQSKFDIIGSDLTDGLWELNVATGETYLSPQWKRSLGYSPDELENTRETWLSLLHPDDLTLEASAMSAHLKDAVPYQVELRHIHKNGDVVWMLSRGAVLDRSPNGTPRTIIGTHTDITRTKEVQAVLEKSNLDLKDFAYVVSHDLQEPLRMISSYTSLLDRRCIGQLDDKSTKYISYIVEGAERMSALLNDLLNFTRLEILPEDFDVVSLDEALDRALSNLSLMSEENSLTLKRDPLPEIHGVPSHLTLIFQNLISNAIKFCKNTPSIRISCVRANDGWTIGVHDNGIGIPVGMQDRIWKMFQRLHTREEHKGNGMGLAMVQRIVENHNGHIWVESEAGKGSSFLFHLPK